MVQFHLRVGGGSPGHRLRQQSAALPDGGVLVQDSQARRVPHVEGPQDRVAQGGLVEGDVDGGGGMRAAVDSDHKVRRLPGAVLRLRYDHHGAGRMGDERQGDG